MKLVIDGKPYPAVGRKSANLRHLFELRIQAVPLLGYELGLARLDELERASRALAGRLKAATMAGDETEVERLRMEQAEDGLVGLAVTIFLSRRKAGDAVTFAESVDIDLGRLELVEEPGDAEPETEAEPDPTVPGDVGPATPAGAPPRRKPKSKTGRSIPIV